MKFLVRITSGHPQKEISLMFEAETVGPCLVRKLKWDGEGHGPPSHPPQWLQPWLVMKNMMYTRSYNTEIMIGEDKDEIIQEIFDSLLHMY